MRGDSARPVFFIDTNIFLRTIVQDKNRKQIEEAKVFLELVRSEDIRAVTSNLVLAEVNWVLSSTYGLSKRAIIPYLAGIVSLKNLRFDDTCNPAQALRLWSIYSIKFVDCLLVSHSRLLQGEMIMVSYDKEFDRIEGVIRKEPYEIVKNIRKI